VTQLSLTGTATPRNECVFSPCPSCGSVPRCGCGVKRTYRYVLKRRINDRAAVCLWVMANPSIADEYKLDPTLTRCADYTERWGFGEMRVVNVRAWIETDSDKVPDDDSIAIGFDNGHHVIENARAANLIVCGWGKLGGTAGLRCAQLLRDEGFRLHALKLNQDGSPQHPLYLAKSLKPFPMEAA
jgi:hypothetical protein